MPSSGSEGWREPTDELVVQALSRLGDLQHRRVFFERLDNPLWVSALDRHEVFSMPPETRVDSEGREYWQPWPEGEYLVRMAPHVPHEVAGVLLRSAASTSPIVHDVLMRAALALPEPEAARLVPPIAKAFHQGTVRHAPEVLDLIERFAAVGLIKPTVRLAQGAFRPRAVGDAETPSSHRRVTAGLEPYWFGQSLPRVVKALKQVQGPKALTTVSAWMEEYQIASREWTPERGYDLSYIWRPSIAPHSQNDGFEDYGDDLVDALRDLALEELAEGRPVEDVLGVLERSGQPLLKRIALHVLATRVNSDPAALAQAALRLRETALLEGDLRHEYAELARAAVPLLDADDVAAWQVLALEGPPGDEPELLARASRGIQEGETPADALVRYREVWQLRLLSGVGRQSLPPLCVERLDALEAKYQPMQHADFPSYSTSWVGPTSPHAVEELSGMDSDQLVALLRSWEPDSTGPGNVSKEGLAREFQAVVRLRAGELVADPDKYSELDPTYMRALFTGLREAMEAGTPFAWEPVLRIASTVAAQADDGTDFEGGRDEDVVWRFAQRAVASLIEMGAGVDGAQAIDAADLPMAVEVLRPLVDHPDPTPEHEDRYGGSNMDPLTLSLNTTRPAALRALIRVGSHAKDLMESGAGDSGDLGPLIDRVLDMAEAHLGSERDSSLAEAAAFGEGLGRLIWMDQLWLESRVARLITADAYGDVVLSTALATYRPSRVMLEVLTPAVVGLLERVARGEEVTSGWRTDRSAVELVGDHLVLLVIQGALDPRDRLLTAFFDMAPKSSIARVLGHLGWLFGRWDEVPADVAERGMALWDMRADVVRSGESTPEELAEFFWWVSSAKFSREWWLSRLEQAVEAQTFDPRGMLGEHLEEAAPEAPAVVARIFERLLAEKDDAFGRYDLIEHAPGIIVAALDSGDEVAADTGRRIMDVLGRSGHLRINELVAQRRRERLR